MDRDSIGFAKVQLAGQGVSLFYSSMLEIISHKLSYVTSIPQEIWKKHSGDALTGLYLVN